MQEVTIRRRDVFYHYIQLDQNDVGKELCWNFTTKKKAIRFGLAFLQDSATQKERTSSIQPFLGESRGSLGASSYISLPPNLTSRNSSKSSVRSVEGSNASLSKPSSPKIQNSEYIMPLARYASGKVTVNGSYLIRKAGTYVLVFDNTFSVNTSKKLNFFVAIRDVDRKDIIDRMIIAGWLLKKGNLSVQGFSRRWVEVHSSGVLTYFKAPGRFCNSNPELAMVQ
jgi:hypothetical protein